MSPDAVPYGRKTQRPSPVSDVHILWITAGLGCDGDSVSVTAAMQPSIEDVLLGAIPGLPKVHLHNPVLAYENGDDFLKFWYEAEAGRLDPFVLVVEGSIPNEKIKKEGYWAALGTNPKTGQPITTNEWIDRIAPKALAVVACGTCATYGGIHAMAGNPTGAMGLADYLGWNWKSKAGLPIVNVPGCPVLGLVPSAAQYPSFLIFSLGIEPSTTRTNGSRRPASASYQNFMKSSPFP